MAKEKPRLLAEAEILERLPRELPKWELKDGWIRRSFTTPGWPHTLMLVNAIGYRAEAAFHHPDLAVSWALVIVKLQTHSAGGITELDLALAKEIEALATWLPDDSSPFEGFPKKWVR
jgi:4a-hydroxytetrahydrobiopterin dehydratase